TVYIYYGMGDPRSPSSTFRVHVSEANVQTDLNWDSNNNLLSITFKNEHKLDLLPGWTNRTYGIIDGMIFVDSGSCNPTPCGAYLYYTVYEVLTDGTVRGYLRSQHMTTYVMNQGDDQEILSTKNGEDDFDRGVAEGARVVKEQGAYVLFYSSRHTDYERLR